MDRKDRIDTFGGSMLIGFAVLMGLNQALIKFVNMAYAPMLQAGLRSLIAMVPVLLVALVLRRRLTIRDGSLPGGIVCGLFFAAEFGLVFMALDYTSISRVSIFFYTMPVWVAFGAHFLIPGERMTPTKALGLFVAVMGVVLALSDGGQATGEMALVGDLMCLVAAMAWAAIALTARATKFSRATPEMQLLYQLVISAPVLIGLAWLSGDMVREPTALLNGILLFQGVVVVGCAILAWFWLLTIYPASDIASFGFLAPVFGVFFGWLLFAEPLTWRLIAALALVGLGIVLVNRRRPG